MKKYLSLLAAILIVLSWEGLGWCPPPPPGNPKLDTNCNQAKYFPLGVLCQDKDDGKLYKGTGTAVVEIAAGGAGDMTKAQYDVADNGKIDADKIDPLNASIIAAGTLAVAVGGTNSSTALNSNRFIVSSSGKIVEASAIAATKPICSDANGLPVACTNLTDIAAAPLASPTFTGVVTVPAYAAGTAGLVINATALESTGAQLNYLKGATGTTGTTTTKIVFDTSPTLVTPVLGEATATSINGLTITDSAAGVFTLVAGKTLTVSKTMQLTSADDSTVATFPAGAGTVGYTGTLTNTKWCRTDGTTIICDQDAPVGAGTITGVGDIASGPAFTVAVPGKTLIFNNDTSGTVTLDTVQGVALGTRTINLPAASGTLVTSPAAGPVNIAGPTAARTITVNDNSFSILIPSGKALTLAGSLTTSGTYDTQFTIPGAYTYTFPSATKTLAASDASNLAVGSDARGDILVRGASAYGRLGKGAAYSLLRMNSGDTDPQWSTLTINDGTTNAITITNGTGSISVAAAKVATFTTSLTVQTGAVTINGNASGSTVTLPQTLTIPAIAQGDVLYGSATNVLSSLAKSTTAGMYLKNSGTSNNPAWATLDPAVMVIASQAQGDILYASSATAWARLGQGTQYKFLITNGASANPSWSAYTMPASIATGDLVYGSGTNAISALTVGSVGKLLRAGASTPAWSTLTMPADIALGSVFAANAAHVLAEINSTSGTKFLQNADGVISWATGVGTIGGSTGGTDNVILTANGIGGVTLQANPGGATISDAGLLTITSILASGQIEAGSFKATKATGIAGDLALYEANSTDADTAGLRGPASLTSNTSFRGQFPNARPTSGTHNALTWNGTAGSGDGTPATPYIHAMSFVDLDTTYLAIAGGTLTGKLTTAVSASPGTAGFNLGYPSVAPGTPANGDLWMTASGLYAYYGGAEVGPFASGAPGFADVTNGTNTNTLAIGTSGSLTTSGTGYISAGGIILGDSTPDADGEIGYATNAYALFANSEDMTLTASSNLWTFASNTSATFAFTPAVGFTGLITPTGGVGAQTPTIDDPDNWSMAGAGLYGGTWIATGATSGVTWPSAAAKMNFTAKVRGAYTVVFTPYSGEKFWLNGTDCGTDKSITSSGTTGDMLVAQYSASGAWDIDGSGFTCVP
jgi:hypothetical protein